MTTFILKTLHELWDQRVGSKEINLPVSMRILCWQEYLNDFKAYLIKRMTQPDEKTKELVTDWKAINKYWNECFPFGIELNQNFPPGHLFCLPLTKTAHQRMRKHQVIECCQAFITYLFDFQASHRYLTFSKEGFQVTEFVDKMTFERGFHIQYGTRQ
jgi:hypothetical protein